MQGSKRANRGTRLGLAALAVGMTLAFSVSAARAGTMQHFDYFPVHRNVAENEGGGVGKLTMDGTGTCSATLIANRWLLTAAHCVDTASSVRFSIGEQSRVAESWYTPDGWTGNLVEGNDIALVKLANPIKNRQIRGLYTHDDGAEENQDALVVGYGNIGTGASGQIPGTTGTRMAGYNRVDGFYQGNEKILSFDADVDPFDSTYTGPAIDYNGSEDFPIGLEYLVAQGDSGGPDFIDGKIAGVHSFGIGAFDLSTNFGFTDTTGSTAVRRWIHWIEAVMADGADANNTSEGLPGAPIMTQAEAETLYRFYAEQHAAELGIFPSLVSSEFGFFAGTGVEGPIPPHAPEPATATLVAVGASLLLLPRRRGRGATATART